MIENLSICSFQLVITLAMEGIIMTLQLILSLSILIILHEFGHFITARMFGIKVEKFYLFFDAWGIKLFKLKKGDTEYGIGWLPLGGYVKISGMIDESMDKEQLKEPAKPWEFRSKPAWQRLIVMLAGVTVNLILGVVIFSMNIAVFEKQYLPMDEINKTGIYVNTSGEKIGFKNGDKIIAVNNKKVERYNDATSIGILFGAKITIERNGEIIDITVPDTIYKDFKRTHQHLYSFDNFLTVVDSIIPNSNAANSLLKVGDAISMIDSVPTPNFTTLVRQLHQHKGDSVKLSVLRKGYEIAINVKIDSLGKIGFSRQLPDIQLKEYSISQAIKYGTSDALETMVVNAKGLGNVFKGEDNVSESVQGPIAIASMFGPVWDWERFWRLTGMLSMVLAFMNVLPIPALDGGHAALTIYEMIARRKPSDKFMEYAQAAGMLLLLSLMVFIFGNDIYRQFFM